MSRLWCTIAPISYSDPDQVLAQGFHLSDDIDICPTPEWFKDSGFFNQLNPDIAAAVKTRSFVLMAQYYGHSLADSDPTWTGKEASTMESRAIQHVQLANLALWIARPSSISIKAIIQAVKGDEEWHRLVQIRNNPLSPHPRDLLTGLTTPDFETARNLLASMNSLHCKGSIWVALRTMFEALAADWWEGRFLFLWVALEALFGPKDAREISHRLAQRIAFFLADDPIEAQALFSTIKKSYAWRSKVAHGIGLDKLSPDTSFSMLHDTETTLRKIVTHILMNPDIISQFNSKTREEYLDSLVFSVHTKPPIPGI